MYAGVLSEMESQQNQSATEPGDAAQQTRTQWSAVITLAASTLIIASEMTMSAFALPLIAAEMGVSVEQTAWVLLAYSLPLAALAIPAGRWIDRSNIRHVFLGSLVLVGLTSILAALAPGFRSLLAARVLLGLASAAYLAVYFPTVRTAVHPSMRGRAMSYIAMIMMIGSIAMAPLGGLVASLVGWRMVFVVKLPFLLIALWLAWRTIPATGAATVARPDRSMLYETLLIGAIITALLFGMERLNTQLPLAFVFLAGAVVLAIVWSRGASAAPVIALLRHSQFGFPVLALTLISTSTGLVSFSLPFFIVEVMQRSPAMLSSAVLAFVMAASVISPAGGWLADRYGNMPVASLGAVLMLGALISLAQISATSTLIDLCLLMAWAGLGMALFNAPNMAAMLKAAPEGQAGTAGGISNVARTLGNTIGPAVTAMMWAVGGGGTSGFRASVLALSVLCATGTVGLLIAWARSRQQGTE